MFFPRFLTAATAFYSRFSPSTIFALTFGFFALGLLVYSQTWSFVWDEGFHLLSAQLIDNGKVPYIDYCFPQTPLNAYWNAFWMRLFDQDWHVTHVLAALEVAGSIYLMADWVFHRFPVQAWRLACAITAMVLIGFNTTVVQFGTVAQAYGVGMFLGAAAFRLTLQAAARSSPWASASAGLVASAAAGCTLLTAPIVPVLLVWLCCYSLAGNRWSKCVAFVAGCVPPFIPVLILFVKAPKQTLFNVVTYQALFRRVNWPGATAHDVDVVTAWLQSTPAMLLVFFGMAGFLFLRNAPDWDTHLKAEFRLCAYLSIAVILYISTAHPTFQRYMVVAVPFLAGLSALGYYKVGALLAGPLRPGLTLLVVSALMLLSISKDLFDDRDATHWKQYEEISRKIREVTPPGAPLYADEHVYFLLRRTPPRAMEFSYSHKLQLPKDQEALYHVVSEAELNEQVKQGKYATVESCKDDRIEELKLTELYPNQKDFGDCSIFWGKLKTQAASK